MLISTFLNADLNWGLISSGEITSLCLRLDLNVLFTVVLLFGNISQY